LLVKYEPVVCRIRLSSNASRKILRLGPPSYGLLGLTVFINTV